MAATLTDNPGANLLGEYMSNISQEVYAAGWMTSTEWNLWHALLDWRATGRAYWWPADHSDDITRHMPQLDWLQKQTGGWVWWLDDGMRFVPEDRWLRLVAARDASRWGWQTKNSELNVAVAL
ncbi:hypothetical protein ABT336_14430 [Micromonospora sp. NPDC000207]|uniref:hypothetical protein n=1 Tax=Micromonospora sp. NPDC000207 TaxID=3154246 RepID=UPI003323F812